MSYLRSLKQLREQVISKATNSSMPEESTTSLIASRQPTLSTTAPEGVLQQSASWLSEIDRSSDEASRSAPRSGGGLASGLVKAAANGINGKRKADKEAEAKGVADQEAAIIKQRKMSELPSGDSGAKGRGEGSDNKSPGYGDISQKSIETIVRQEAALRNMDPDTAVAIFRSEGAGSYQSQVARSGKGAFNGKEDSYGPFQLYRGGGLGNQYESQTGRNLREDNTLEGITNQIRFGLDAAVDSGWTPWYGRKHAGVGVRDGLSNAKKAGNWK